MTLRDLILQAQAADVAYEATVRAAGYKSRWDVPSKVKHGNSTLHSAYLRKVEADALVHAAWEAQRARYA